MSPKKPTEPEEPACLGEETKGIVDDTRILCGSIDDSLKALEALGADMTEHRKALARSNRSLATVQKAFKE